jgi:N-acetylglucosamine kinase-like BadF-type ATPase
VSRAGVSRAAVSRAAVDDGSVAVLAVDGGNLKTDLALVARDGRVLAAIRGPSISHQAVGLHAGTATLVELVAEAARRGGVDPDARPLAEIAVFTVAGADFRRHETMLHREYSGLCIAGSVVVRNDAFAPLRAGTDGVGVAVICGAGMNCAGVSRTGRTARFPALGDISGDWGGGGALGLAALWHAIRGRDGRGPSTVLSRVVPAHFGLNRPLAVTVALEEKRLRFGRLRELAPLVFDAAAGGDAVARSIVDRQADEIVAMATTIIGRLGMRRAAVPVVLAGGVTRTDEPLFWARIRAGITALAPRAAVSRLDRPPVVGAALLGLDALGLERDERTAAEGRLRAELIEARIEPLEPPIGRTDRQQDARAGRRRR